MSKLFNEENLGELKYLIEDVFTNKSTYITEEELNDVIHHPEVLEVDVSQILSNKICWVTYNGIQRKLTVTC